MVVLVAIVSLIMFFVSKGEKNFSVDIAGQQEELLAVHMEEIGII